MVYNNQTGIVDKLRDHMASVQMNILVAEDKDSLKELLSMKEISVVLLDVKPDRKRYGEEIALITAVRQNSRIPVIVVSECVEEIDQIMALEAGVDDYVIADDNPLVIIAKIRARLRR